MRREDRTRDHSSVDGTCVVQIGHRLGEGHSRYGSSRSRHMVGLGKQHPAGAAASEPEVLDWEKPATRGHDGLTVLTWTFLHAE